MKSSISIAVVLVFVISMLFGCSAIGLHEVGHFLAYELFGCSPQLHYDHTSAQFPANQLEADVVTLAGLGSTMMLSFVSLLLMYLTRSALFLSLGMTMAGRNIAALPLILLGIAQPHDENDYLSISQSLPPYTIYVAILIVNLVTVAFLVKFVKENRLALVASTALGGITGAVLWLFLLGPLVLP